MIGSLIRKASVVRFCRILGTLLQAGVGLPESLKLMLPTAETPQIGRTISDMEIALRQGEQFPGAAGTIAHFPAIIVPHAVGRQ